MLVIAWIMVPKQWFRPLNFICSKSLIHDCKPDGLNLGIHCSSILGSIFFKHHVFLMGDLIHYVSSDWSVYTINSDSASIIPPVPGVSSSLCESTGHKCLSSESQCITRIPANPINLSSLCPFGSPLLCSSSGILLLKDIHIHKIVIPPTDLTFNSSLKPMSPLSRNYQIHSLFSSPCECLSSAILSFVCHIAMASFPSCFYLLLY